MSERGNLPARRRGLRSDNASGMCPEALAALAEVNSGHTVPYGDDEVTARAAELVRELVGAPQAAVFFVFNGTAANALALATIAPPQGVVAVSPAAHVFTDECGAPGFFSHGLQLRPLRATQGKLDPEALAGFAALRDLHWGKPAVVSLSQATELGTSYSLAELAAIREAARDLRLRLHIDGARLANSCAALGVTPAEVAQASGVDALVVGGTKNGLPISEALVFFDPALAEDFPFRRKQAGQLASKHRFLAAPWIGVLESGAWMRNAHQANRRAHELARGAATRGFPPLYPVEGNEVFLTLDPRHAARLAESGFFLYWEDAWQAHRCVCSWDTSEGDVEEFLDHLSRTAP
jgi:threonine aldolase